MNLRIIFKEKPKCDYCGLPMKEWNPYADSHTHSECIVERFGKLIEDMLKKQIEEKLSYEIKKLDLINRRRIENGFQPVDTTNEIILLTKLNNNL
jgi:hypothetical protein